MLMNTHMIIGNIVYRTLQKRLGFKLNKGLFLFGTIKPDFKNSDINKEHTVDESLDSLINFIDKLYITNDINKFSVSLGVICHYVCDYFCLYHSRDYKDKGTIEHFFYELKLHITLIYTIFKGLLSLYGENRSYNNIKEIITLNQIRYGETKNHISKDIKYSINTALVVIQLVVEESLIYRYCDSYDKNIIVTD